MSPHRSKNTQEFLKVSKSMVLYFGLKKHLFYGYVYLF